LLYPPSEELLVRRDVNSLVAKLRAEGRQVEVIDCNQVLLDYLHRAEELQRAIRAEKRNPSVLKEFGIGKVLAEALVERVITAQQQMSGPGVVVLTRVGALHPFPPAQYCPGATGWAACARACRVSGASRR
jgi:hypothetical protein